MDSKKQLRFKKWKALGCFALIVLFSLMCTVTVSATQSRSSNFRKTYTLTGNQPQDLLAVALAQQNLTNRTLKYTEAWCADFVLDCARLAKIPDNVIPYSYKYGGGCRYLYNYMLNSCAAVTTTSPKPGDLVFYYCSSCKIYVHVGIYAGSGYCIEGNVGGKVLKYNTSYLDSSGHSVKSGTIRRIYVRPNYKRSMSDCTIKLSASTFTYTGYVIIPGYSAKYGSTALKPGTDFTVSCTNNINAGTATMTFTGKGKYIGTKKVTFKILPKNMSALTYAPVRNRAYTGSQIRPTPTVIHNVRVLSSGVHYTVSYGTNKYTGRATITLTGKGNYTGSRTIVFYIVPKQVTGVSLKVSRRNLTVSYSRAVGATGYQIAYRKKGTSNWTTVNNSITSKTLSLSAFTNYEVRVRAFVQVKEGSTVSYKYGAWSSISAKRTLI